MPKRDEEKVFDEADVLIIAGAALGMSQEAIGNWICTPAFPAGVSERTVRNRISENRESYDRLVTRIGAAFTRKKEEFEELTKADYRQKLEKLRAKGLRVKELALDQGIEMPYQPEFLKLAVNVAESLEDRDFGKAKQVVDHSGEVNHTVFVWTSETREQLLAQEHDMLEAGTMLKALPGDVLEAEVVADA